MAEERDATNQVASDSASAAASGGAPLPRGRRRPHNSVAPSPPPLAPLLLLMLLSAAPRALAQVAVPQGLVSPIWKCPSGADIQPGKPTSYQTFCAQEFAVCMANPEMSVGGPYTALTVRTRTCTWCFADAWACYSDCPTPGFPLQWQASCIATCAPDLAFVCSGGKPTAAS